MSIPPDAWAILPGDNANILHQSGVLGQNGAAKGDGAYGIGSDTLGVVISAPSCL